MGERGRGSESGTLGPDPRRRPRLWRRHGQPDVASRRHRRRWTDFAMTAPTISRFLSEWRHRCHRHLQQRRHRRDHVDRAGWDGIYDPAHLTDGTIRSWTNNGGSILVGGDDADGDAAVGTAHGRLSLYGANLNIDAGQRRRPRSAITAPAARHLRPYEGRHHGNRRQRRGPWRELFRPARQWQPEQRRRPATSPATSSCPPAA